MGKSQRTKGAVGEREVCHLIQDVLGVNAKRNLSQTREGGCDIAVGPYHVEVKRRARIGNIYDWIEQAEASCQNGERPVVFCRADKKKWLVVMSAEEALRLLGNEL
ncbi:MAG TPA: hypothetical protein IAC66_07470 [Candidatus Aphodousia gallistercoris]|nr:hypothetical protein [Candidatus Aphodousia gallistercoris]